MFRMQTIRDAEWNDLGGLFGTSAENILKSLEAQHGVDAAEFTGGRALGYESLDNILQNVTLTQEHAAMWKALPKRPIHATVDQFTRRTSMGDEWGIAVQESSNPADHLAELARMYAECAYYRTRREVSDVAMMVNNIENPASEEETAGTNQIIMRLDRDMYWANRNVIGTRIHGFYSHLYDGHNDGNKPEVVSTSADGQVISGREDFEGIAADVFNEGGLITHAFCNPLIAADFSAAYSDAERIWIEPGANASGDERVWVGADVGGIMTAMGGILWEKDPFNKIGWECPSSAQGDTNRPTAPDAVSGATGGSGGDIPAGTYYYKVTAVNEYGETTAVATNAVVVAEGENVTLTITNGDASNAAGGFRIYRSAKDAGSADDCRFLWHVPLAAGDETTFVDDGFFVPGTSHVAMLGLSGDQPGVQWSQLLPLTKKKLAETGPTQPFLLNLYGTLRVAKPEWTAVYRNVLPRKHKDAGWDPLGHYA